MLASSAFAAEHEKGKTLPSEVFRYADASTEIEVARLTDPGNSSFLLAAPQNAISRKSSFLIYVSDRSGTWQAYRMDLKTGESHQLTEAESLDPASVLLLPDDHGICYADGLRVITAPLSSLHERELFVGAGPLSHLCLAGDGRRLLFVESQEKGLRLRSVGLLKGEAGTLLNLSAPLQFLLPRPSRAQAIYSLENGASFLLNTEGKQARPLPTTSFASLNAGALQWIPSGKSFTYLRVNPEDAKQQWTLWEYIPEANSNKALAPTSQFVQASPNEDGSVFVGASRSKAGPFILLLLRVTRREFTLCEHRSSHPETAHPRFSPDSQSVFFQSDRHGKPAIYRVRVDRLVEETSN